MNEQTVVTAVAIVAVAGLVAGLIGYFSQRKARKELEERLEGVEKELSTLRKTLKELKQESDNVALANAHRLHEEELERQRREQRRQEAAAAAAVSKPKPQHKDAFFGTPKGDAEMALFNDLYEELRDECFFSVQFTDTDKAEYEPIDLMRLKSLPALEGVVRYDGCTLNEARTFQLKSKGTVQRQNNYWVVISPAELQLMK